MVSCASELRGGSTNYLGPPFSPWGGPFSCYPGRCRRGAANARRYVQSSVWLVGAGHVILRRGSRVAGVHRLLAGIIRTRRPAILIERRARRTSGPAWRRSGCLAGLLGLASLMLRRVLVIVSATIAGRRCCWACGRGRCRRPMCAGWSTARRSGRRESERNRKRSSRRKQGEFAFHRDILSSHAPCARTPVPRRHGAFSGAARTGSIKSTARSGSRSSARRRTNEIHLASLNLARGTCANFRFGLVADHSANGRNGSKADLSR
jgi:hypothetical protein